MCLYWRPLPAHARHDHTPHQRDLPAADGRQWTVVLGGVSPPSAGGVRHRCRRGPAGGGVRPYPRLAGQPPAVIFLELGGTQLSGPPRILSRPASAAAAHPSARHYTGTLRPVLPGRCDGASVEVVVRPALCLLRPRRGDELHGSEPGTALARPPGRGK